MLKYPNKSGNSGVEAYRIGKSFIDVKFYKHKETYRYYKVMIGEKNFNTMCLLANKGEGLNTFINQNVLVKNSDL